MRTARSAGSKTCDKVPGRRPGTALTHRADSFPLFLSQFFFHCHSPIPFLNDRRCNGGADE
jgi:hypothetical protein